MSRPPNSARQCALARGDKRYHSTPCRRCGGTERYTCSASCVVCQRDKAAKFRAHAPGQPGLIARYSIENYSHDESAPCDACPQQLVCKARSMACKDFSHYQQHGRLIESDRKPSRQIYTSMFVEEAA